MSEIHRVNNFELNAKLQSDSHIVANSNTSILLLNKNALFPWFVLVPKTTEKELYRLDENLQIQLLKQTRSVSFFVDKTFTIDKMNIATIGNVVSQLHIHIVGRNKGDVCWPNVVWGTDHFQSYQRSELNRIITALKKSKMSDFEVVNGII